MWRHIASVVFLSIAVVLSASASANVLSYSSFSVVDPQVVTLSGDALGHQETAYAGEIKLLGINGGTGTLSTFCIDVADWLTPSGQFSTGNYLSGSFAEQVNALLTHVLPTLATDSNASAALQVAIWETEYGSSLNVSGSRDVVTLANDYIGDVTSGRWMADGSMRVAILDGGGKDQSQAYLSPISEPASLALLGMAVLASAMWARQGRVTEKANRQKSRSR